MIAILFTMPGSVYEAIPGCDCWGEDRDARKYKGPYRVIAHPPCARWGRYWSGGPSATERRHMGDDSGCFASAIWAVRTFGGVLEHPRDSNAWAWYGLRRPSVAGGWVSAGDGRGVTCCVAQYWYGHAAQKFTWLYGVDIPTKALHWGKPATGSGIRLEDGLSATQRLRQIKTGRCQRLSHRQRAATPRAFAQLLVSLVAGKEHT